MSNRVTLKDIATRAGVSQSTVSVFLKGQTDVCSAETAERIRSAVVELNYTRRKAGVGSATPEFSGLQAGPAAAGAAVATYDAPVPGHRNAAVNLPGSAASALRQSRRSRNIGMIFSPDQDLLAPSEPPGSSTYRSDLIWRGIAQAIEWEDYGLLSYPSSVRNSTDIEPFLDGAAAGVILAAADPAARAEGLAAAGLPVLLLGGFQDIPDGCAAVCAYERDTVELALDYLWSLGHHRIAHLAGPAGDVATARRDRCERWMRSRGVYAPALVQGCDSWGGGDGRPEQALNLWLTLPEPPTAVFCAGDALARSLIAAVKRRGLSVPGDLSVVGVGDALAGSGSSADAPERLTTIALPNERIGQEAVRLLLRMIDGVAPASCRTAVPVTQLLIRDTTAAPPPHQK